MIISTSGLKALDLPRLKRSEAVKATIFTNFQEGGTRDSEPEDLSTINAEFLGFLWEACVRPILEHILSDFVPYSDCRKMPRVWWIGTGSAS